MPVAAAAAAAAAEGPDVASVEASLSAVSATQSYKTLKANISFLDGTWDDNDFGSPKP